MVAGIGSFGLALTVDLRHLEYLLFVGIPTALGWLMGIAIASVEMPELDALFVATGLAAICFIASMIGARRAGIPQSWHNYPWREPRTLDGERENSAR